MRSPTGVRQVANLLSLGRGALAEKPERVALGATVPGTLRRGGVRVSGDGHPVLDNMNKAVGVTPDEAKQVLDEGFRQILGCELWTSRCTMPDTSYAASVLMASRAVRAVA